jgi:hypothetical protein
MQLSVAAHACATLSLVNLEAPKVAATAPSHEACKGADQQPTKLCEQHCLQAAKSVDTQPNGVPTVPHLPLIAVVDRLEAYAPAKLDGQSNRLPGAVDPPPLVRFGVLRI